MVLPKAHRSLMPKSRSIGARAVVYSLIGMLLLAVSVAVMRGVSSVNEYILQQHLDAWSKAGAPPALEQWNKVDGFFQTALSLTPDNPDLLQYGGRLHEWRAIMEADGRGVDKEAMAQALDYYWGAIKNRPSWPYAWMEFSVAKARAGQLDEVFQRAFSNALKLGPWEPQIQEGMTKLGFAVYAELTRENRLKILQNMRNFAEKHPRRLFQLAKEHHQLLLLCYGVKGNEVIGKLCRQQGLTKKYRKPRP